ncbi:MAG: T9SS type A sorting domain-containing protein [Bacteroidetes bacterium]|nr:T9SS type A sorting domain-containing protein [Bacteroidota bacterium]
MKSIIQTMRLTGLLVLITLFLGVSTTWATTPVEKLVQKSGEAEARFSVEKSRIQTNEFDHLVSEYVVFEMDQSVSKAVMQDAPKVIELTFPTSRGNFNLKLVEQKITTEDFRVESSSGTVTIDGQVGVHYRGIVDGFEGSIAAVSFFDGNMSLFASTKEFGNFTANETEINGAKRYVSYFDKDLLIESGFECDTEAPDEIPAFLQDERILDIAQQQQGGDVCVRVHFEGDFGLYEKKGNVTNSAAYIEAIFNVTTLLYSNESINTIISYIKIWDTPDDFGAGFGGSTSLQLNNLTSYFETEAEMQGDLGHLVSYDEFQSLGGIAWLNRICFGISSGCAVSRVTSTYSNFPTYSWTVMVVTHEMGHNLGSPHTHDCVWNGNSTQIDDCYNASSQNPSPGFCYDSNNPIIPAEGGTIMSYCHFQSVGFNLTLGFGPQPGDLIRATINSCSNLTACPIVDCPPPYQLEVVNIDETTATVSWFHADETEFEVTVTSNDGSTVIPVSGAISLDLTGLIGATQYTVSVQTNCSGGDSDIPSQTFQTLCNTVFTLPYVELFESNSWVVRSYDVDPCWTNNLDNDGYGWSIEDFATTSAGADTGPDFDHTTGFGKYIFTEADLGDQFSQANIVSPAIDLETSVGPLLSFWYHMFGSGIDGIRVDVSTDDGSSWNNVQVINGQQQTATEDPWRQSVVSLSAFEGETIRVRFVGKRGPNEIGDMAIDDVIVTDSSLVDVSVASVISPATGCGLSAAEPVVINVINSGYQTVSSGTMIGLDLEMNEAAVTSETLVLASDLEPGASVEYTFTSTLDLSVDGLYNVSVVAALAGDGISGNNTGVGNVISKPIISTYPYTQSFETGSDWTSGGINNTWAMGTPSKAVITGASDGVNAWVTGGLFAEYSADEESFVEGPCFDFSNLQDPTITMDVWWDIEPFWEGAQFQYSTDQGETWETLGDSSANWYNASYILTMLPAEGGVGWTGSQLYTDPARAWLQGSEGWVTVSQDLTGLGLEPSVFMRVIFKSDAFEEYDGIGFDNIIIDGTAICHRIDVDETTCVPGEEGITVLELEDESGCDSIVTKTITLLTSHDIVIQEYSCETEDTGQVVQDLENEFGCDSTVTTIISLWPRYQYSLQATTCDPEMVGIELMELQTTNGCDSIVLVNTALQDPYETLIEQTTCNTSEVMTQTDTMLAVDGCDSIVTTMTTFDPVDSDFDYTATNGSVTFNNLSSNATTYSWSFGDGNTNDVENPTNTYTTESEYEVVLIASNAGCESDTHKVTINIVISGVNLISFIESVNIFPNPNDGNFAVEIKGDQLHRDMNFTLFDVAGSTLESREVTFSSYSREVYSLNEIPNGMYFLRIRSGEEQTTIKINVLR